MGEGCVTTPVSQGPSCLLSLSHPLAGAFHPRCHSGCGSPGHHAHVLGRKKEEGRRAKGESLQPVPLSWKPANSPITAPGPEPDHRHTSLLQKVTVQQNQIMIPLAKEEGSDCVGSFGTSGTHWPGRLNLGQ